MRVRVSEYYNVRVLVIVIHSIKLLRRVVNVLCQAVEDWIELQGQHRHHRIVCSSVLFYVNPTKAVRGTPMHRIA